MREIFTTFLLIWLASISSVIAQKITLIADNQRVEDNNYYYDTFLKNSSTDTLYLGSVVQVMYFNSACFTAINNQTLISTQSDSTAEKGYTFKIHSAPIPFITIMEYSPQLTPDDASLEEFGRKILPNELILLSTIEIKNITSTADCNVELDWGTAIPPTDLTIFKRIGGTTNWKEIPITPSVNKPEEFFLNSGMSVESSLNPKSFNFSLIEISAWKYQMNLDAIESGELSIEMYNSIGARIVDIFTGKINPGINTFEWEPKNVPNGVYYCRVKFKNDMQITPVSIIR